MCSSETRKEAPARTSPQEKKSDLHAAFGLGDTVSIPGLQASRLRRRFNLSWPLALAIAELAYQTGRAA